LAILDDAIEEQSLEQLSTVYLLLRTFPAAITSGVLLRKPAVFRDTKGKGMVSTHYLVLLYSWTLQKNHLAMLQEVILNTRQIPEELEH
jgi:hypothetical protein